MPPKKKARRQQSRGSRQNMRSSDGSSASEPQPSAQGPGQQFIQLSSDVSEPAGNKNLSENIPESSSLSTWADVLVQRVSNEILAQNTQQSEFQMPDVRCADDDLALHVPQDICIKIWKNEYINLAVLLKRNQKRRGDETGNLYVNKLLQLQTRPQVLKEINNIREWTDAFLIFMSIYLKKHQNKVFELLQYMSTIREAESRCQNLAWRDYDAEFRTRQALKQEPWNKIYTDLWLKLMTNTSSVETQIPQTKLSTGLSGHYNQSRPARGICFDFNKGRCYFKNCRFSHICLACKGEHAEKQCPHNITLQNIPENSSTNAQPGQSNVAQSQKPFRGPPRRR